MMNNNLVAQFLTQINNAIDYKLQNITQIKSAIVHSVNQDNTVNITIPPNYTIYHRIQNQSIYRNLHPGDQVKVIAENGSLSNMWIVGGFGLQSNIDNPSTSNQIDINLIYPVGSIYISINNSNPQALFGGQWEQIQDRFLLAAGEKYKTGDIGGESEHTLTVDEMPKHTHNDGTDELRGLTADDTGSTSAIVYFDPNRGTRNTTPTGGNQPHNNMPPYLTVYMWKRVG